MGFAFMSHLGEHLEHLTFQGVVPTGDADLPTGFSGVGSLLRGPLIALRTVSSCGSSAEESAMDKSSN